VPKKIFIIIAVIAIAAVAALILSRRSNDVKGEIRVSGTIEATTVELSFKVAGRLARRLVDEGMQVAAGQPVALLEDDELKLEQSARSADEKALRAAVADLEAGSRREEIAQGEAALNRTKVDADKLGRDAQRAETLFAREIIARQELDAARAGRDASAAAVSEAEQRLKLLRAGPRPDAVSQARARVDAAVAARAQSETRLAQAVLTSPLTGVVLAKNAEPGEILSVGTPVLTVAKTDEVWLRGYIAEADVGRVALGQKARVTADAWPGRIMEGKVSFISSEAEFTPKNVQTEKERVKLVYRIKITLPNPKGELKPGMPVDAVIVTTP
jgi:HlyD family secretion protein